MGKGRVNVVLLLPLVDTRVKLVVKNISINHFHLFKLSMVREALLWIILDA